MGLPRWDTMRRSFTPDSQKPRLYLGSLNGAKETRTPDPLHAMQVLYQLSYGPNNADRHEPVLRRAEAYNGDARDEPTLTSVAIQRRACPGPEPDRQAAQWGHKRD